jgi:hypothetical protein
MARMKAGRAVIYFRGRRRHTGIVGHTTNSIVTELYGRRISILWTPGTKKAQPLWPTATRARRPTVFHDSRSGIDQSAWGHSCLQGTRAGGCHQRGRAHKHIDRDGHPDSIWSGCSNR